MAISTKFRPIFWPCILAVALTLQWVSLAQLQVGFYSNSCPDAESIVSSVVREFAQSDVTILAALLRLHYHDCIVQGCDGSVLITQPAGAGNNLEKSAQNHAGLRGFDVIDQAKAQLEAQCPGVVSCADILALAARDSVFLSEGPFYELPTGRRDGRVSNISDADNMPEVHESIDVLKAKFAAKGLSGNDLVLLSAAHTIGTTACFFLESRLYNFGGRGGSDPSINPAFLPELESQCPQGGDVNARLPLDRGSETVFDAQILRNIQSGFAAIESDAQLYADASTSAVVDSYLDPLSPFFGPFFRSDFAESMVRMGGIGVRTGADGEVRQNCAKFN